MLDSRTITLIMPARNEEDSLPFVLESIPSYVDRVVIVDNGSIDSTGNIARDYGCMVVAEPLAGYGRACLAGIEAVKEKPPDIVVFADADGSDDLSRLNDLLYPLINDGYELVLEQRIPLEPKALTLQQRIGNKLSTFLVWLIWKHRYKDLGPMRAITWEALSGLEMADQDYGWTLQMQIRAIKTHLAVKEVPVSCKPRIAGKSKISGTLSGTVKAAVKILKVIWIEARETFIKD